MKYQEIQEESIQKWSAILKSVVETEFNMDYEKYQHTYDSLKLDQYKVKLNIQWEQFQWSYQSPRCGLRFIAEEQCSEVDWALEYEKGSSSKLVR